ncbi:MAG TPA: NUDIX domain-containing protein [Caldimonas sp.]|nr:NUDIX domain-containing protein [Caldimonas sp.]HEV7577123.1 NUDIX domain-containing protein [Caldimonas sp.]
MSGIDSDWLQRARQRADAAPVRPRVGLDLEQTGSRHRIGSIEPRIAARIAAAGLPLRCGADACCITAPTEASLSAIARWLHAEGIASHWRDELLAVVDVDGHALGAIERGVVRVLGLATEAVHLIGHEPSGRTWVQLRAATKSTDPGRWDTLMGGQVAAGESIDATLARETMEEAGLAIAELHELERSTPIVLRRPVREGYMVERIEVFRAVVADGVLPINRDGEVDRFECLADADLVRRLAADEFTLEATLILGAELERRGVVRAAPPL